MKKILGSLVWLLVALQPAVAAEGYFFKATVSKNELFAGEAAVLEVSFYKKREISTVIGKFLPEQHAGYELQEFQLESSNDATYAIDTFVYLLRFEKPGRYALPLYGEIQKFNEQDIVDSNNHRDAMMAIAASKEKVFVTELGFAVLPSSDGLGVGEFTLSLLANETSVLENEPVHFSVSIEGEGDVQTIPFPRIAVEGSELFVQEGERKRWLQEGRLFGRKTNHYALVAKEGFTLPALQVAYFSPSANAVRVAETTPLTVAIQSDASLSQAALLDDESEQSGSDYWSWERLKTWGMCGLVFLGGFLAARLKLPRRDSEESGAVRAIRKASTQKELLHAVLPLAHRPEFKELISRLESQKLDRAQFAALKKEMRFIAKKQS